MNIKNQLKIDATKESCEISGRSAMEMPDHEKCMK